MEQHSQDISLPEWAPESYRKQVQGMPPDHPLTATFLKMSSAPEMEGVWRRIRSRCEREAQFQVVALEMAMVVTSRHWWRMDVVFRMTHSERKRTLNRLADKVDAVVQEMAELEIDYASGSFYTDDEIDGFQKLLRFEATCKSKDDAIWQVRRALENRSISLNDLLPRISEDLRRTATRQHYVKHPDSPDADLHYVVRALSTNLRAHFGTPLHEIVATIVSVIFDREIDVDRVRMLVKDLPEPVPDSDPE